MDLLQDYMENEDVDATITRFEREMAPEERLEFMVILEKMLWFGPSTSMKRFVRVLLENGDLQTSIRCRMAELVFEADDPDYVNKIRNWISLPDMEVVCRIEWMGKIQRYPTYSRDEQVSDWMENVFRHESIAGDAFYRNRAVMDAYHTIEDIETFVAVMREYKKEFLDPVMYRVAFAHTLLVRDKETAFEKDSVADLFLTEGLDELLADMLSDIHPPETQADICDFFLHTEYERITAEHRAHAQRIMTRLFMEDMTSTLSIFSNRQNVHSESIETSAQDVLQALHEKYGMKSAVSFQQIQIWRSDIQVWPCYKTLTDDDRLKVEVAINRIVFDKRLYGKTGDTLSTILGLVWKHVHVSDHKTELQKRLLEELIEGSGQCSTGIAIRLLNTLSGFDDFRIGISYREAIMARVVHHMTRVIKEMADTDKQASLLEEMTEPDSAYTDRKNFLELFRREIPVIKEELYAEYKDVLADIDFDMYLKQAVAHYQHGSS